MRQQKVKAVQYGLEIVLHCAPQLWPLVPADLNSLPNIHLLKSKIKHCEIKH